MTTFIDARAVLLSHRTDLQAARAAFRWPDPVPFNWALDWFDAILARDPESRDRPALEIVDAATGSVERRSFAEMAARSNIVANRLRALGLRRGERILMMLGNTVPLWEIMLAAMKLGAVVIPATTLLTAQDAADRIARGGARFVITSPEHAAKVPAAGLVRILVGGAPLEGWTDYESGPTDPHFVPDGITRAEDPMLVYFTSGTTAKPKRVMHSHYSYPIGHLSTMYWLGLIPGDRHLNISSPGWAKHAWSCFFAPWNAGATVFIVNMARFEAAPLLDIATGHEVTTLCAPPTVWRMLAQEDLGRWRTRFRELAAAGEPLNPEIIARFRTAWGLTIRDGYGQTETTAQIGNPPGQALKPGSMGRPLPGYDVTLLDLDDHPALEGEICLPTMPTRPAGLMLGYQADDGTALPVPEVYRTGDVATLDDEGYLTFVGRTDDVFKSSDYRISPFELESILIEHPSVVEAAVVPSPDPLRLAVPKAYVSLAAGVEPNRETALSIFRHTHAELAPYKRVRRLEFTQDLPKTISGKIRRTELRTREQAPQAAADVIEFVAADFAELKGGGDA